MPLLFPRPPNNSHLISVKAKIFTLSTKPTLTDLIGYFLPVHSSYTDCLALPGRHQAWPLFRAFEHAVFLPGIHAARSLASFRLFSNVMLLEPPYGKRSSGSRASLSLSPVLLFSTAGIWRSLYLLNAFISIFDRCLLNIWARHWSCTTNLFSVIWLGCS